MNKRSKGIKLKINWDLKKTNNNIRKSLKTKLMFSYIIVALISIILIASLTFINNKNVLINKVTELSKKTTVQTKLSVNSYIREVQNITALIFAQDDITGYNPNMNSADKYKKEGDITEYLKSLSLIKNFSDFGLICDNGKAIGKISETDNSADHMKTLFDKYKKELDQDKAIWITGDNSNYNKLYYIREINNEMILITSIPVEELDTIFDGVSDGNMSILLIDNKDSIIYSTNKDEIGTKVDDSINENIKDVDENTFEQNNELMALDTCSNAWKLVTKVPKSYILGEVQTSGIITIIITIICIIISGVFGLIFAKKISSPINKLVGKMQRAESGDLTVITEVVGEDEIAILCRSFNNMIASIRSLIEETKNVSGVIVNEAKDLNEMSEQTSETSEGITKAMEGIAEGAVDQANKLEDTISNMDKLAQSIGDIILNIANASSISNETREIGDKSLNIAKELDEKTKNTNEIIDTITSNIEVLTNSIKEIEQVINVISGISEQTNLLSLNASIEAARAGESGKGFAVVAEEVKKLAEESRESTKSINEVIKDVYAKADSTKQLINNSRNAFKAQAEAVKFTNQSFMTIIGSTEKVSVGMENIQKLINEINLEKLETLEAANSIKNIMANSSANTEEVLAATQEQAAGAEGLEESSRKLREVVNKLEDSLSAFKTN